MIYVLTEIMHLCMYFGQTLTFAKFQLPLNIILYFVALSMQNSAFVLDGLAME